jgi:hypothetical protein
MFRRHLASGKIRIVKRCAERKITFQHWPNYYSRRKRLKMSFTPDEVVKQTRDVPSVRVNKQSLKALSWPTRFGCPGHHGQKPQGNQLGDFVLAW